MHSTHHFQAIGNLTAGEELDYALLGYSRKGMLLSERKSAVIRIFKQDGRWASSDPKFDPSAGRWIASKIFLFDRISDIEDYLSSVPEGSSLSEYIRLLRNIPLQPLVTSLDEAPRSFGLRRWASPSEIIELVNSGPLPLVDGFVPMSRWVFRLQTTKSNDFLTYNVLTHLHRLVRVVQDNSRVDGLESFLAAPEQITSLGSVRLPEELAEVTATYFVHHPETGALIASQRVNNLFGKPAVNFNFFIDKDQMPQLRVHYIDISCFGRSSDSTGYGWIDRRDNEHFQSNHSEPLPVGHLPLDIAHAQ